MHSDMNTKVKLAAFRNIEEEILVTVAGQIPAQKKAGKVMSAGIHLWSVTDEATETMNESNFYLCVTKDNLHFCILNSYNPDIIRRRVSFPRDEAEITLMKEGKLNDKYILKTESEEVILVIPKTRGFTGLKDQAESARLFKEVFTE